MSQLRRRRDVLKWSVVAVAAAPSACYRSGHEGVLSESDGERYFPQSLASGDPRPESIVLWTRVEDPNRAGQDLLLELLLALDPDFTQPVTLTSEAGSLPAPAASDHCAIVRVAGLMPNTTYYYRFRYLALEGTAQTRVGRTKTAPPADADTPVKFAVVCCQDYNGKYFHVHRHVAERDDLDFVLHLGDYVYETVGDPSFQSPTKQRRVVFSAPEAALELGSDGSSYLAAQSLSNYRDLYKTYRSDPDLQALHERHPVIAIWDDHEFSDDCHGDVASYLDGTVDEASPARRAAADQAWFEFMPVDYLTMPAKQLDTSGEFPDNFAIYRGFVFGQHLELLVTDLRRFRPDHVVPEDAMPGAVCVTQSELEALGELPADAVPYLDIASFAKGAYREALRDGAEALGITAESVTGNISAPWINESLLALGGEGPEPIDLADAELERGYAYHSLLKSSQFSRVGSRYVLALEPFQALCETRFLASDGQSENLLGDTQRAWFVDTLRASTCTFKVWASEVAFQPRHIDLTGLTVAPPELQRPITISAEDWDGFPNERRQLLGELVRAKNAVVLSGDLHCFFAGTPYLAEDPEQRVVELTTGSVTSTTWLAGIERMAETGAIPMEAQLLVANIDQLLADKLNRPNPHLAFQELGRHGYSIVEVGGDELGMTIHTLSSEDVATAPADLAGELDELFTTERFRTRAGTSDLEHEVKGEFLTWNIEDMEFQ